MVNLVLLVITVTLYLVISYFVWTPVKKKESRGMLQRTGILLLLCMPFNIGGDVYTVIGNAQSRTNIYSVCSFLQVAEKNAVSIFGPFCVQRAGNDAIVFFGAVFNQAAGDDAALGAGLAIDQQAKDNAFIFIGPVLCQQAEDASGVLLGLAGYQRGNSSAEVIFGLAGYQQSEREVFVVAGGALYQKVPKKDRWFGLVSVLVAN